MTTTIGLPAAVAAALLALSVVPFANVASATPVADALAIKNAAPLNVETVQWRHRGWRGGGWGIGAGLLGGAIIGGMLASPYYYGAGPYGGYYGSGPYGGYYGSGPYYGGAPGYVPLRETGWRTARSGSGLMIRAAAHTSALTASAIHVHERMAAVTSSLR